MSSPKGKTVLAVLVIAPVLCCALGTGAFLHVVVSYVAAQSEEDAQLRQQSQSLAEDAAELERELAEINAQIAQLHRELAELRSSVERARTIEEELRQLQAKKAELESQLAALRDKLSRARDVVVQEESRAKQECEAAARAKSQVEQAQAGVVRAQANVAGAGDKLRDARHADNNSGPLESSQDLQNQLAQKQQGLEQARLESEQLMAELANARQARKEKESTFEVETIKSTKRWNAPKPVYVDCDQEGIILQPAGIRLNTVPDAGDRSRFLAAAKTTRYVLFLIRPAGFTSFEQYRDLLEAEAKENGESLDYGYEPINEDWKLVFPDQRS